MKILKILFIAALLVGANSCSKSDDTPPEPESASLEGRWVPESYTYVGSITLFDGEQTSRILLNGTGKDFAVTVTFNEDPNSYSFSGSYVLRLVTTLPSGDEVIEEAPLIFNENGTYTHNGNSITFDSDGEQIQGSISELTETSLRISRNINNVEVNGTSTTTTSVVETYILSRRN